MHANGLPPRRLAARVRVYLLAGMAGLLVLLGMSGCMSHSGANGEATDIPPSQPAETVPGPTADPIGSAVPHTDPPSMTGTTPDRTQGGSSMSDKVAVVGNRVITRSALIEKLWKGYGIEVLREMMLHEAVMLEAADVGATVTEEELERELRKMSAGYASEEEFYTVMQRQLGMDRQAVREDARYHLLLEKLATWHVHISETQIRQYYESHPEEFGPRIQYKLSWILTSTEKEAEQVLSELVQGADFAELARRYSQDAATADEGGVWGWIDEHDPIIDAELLAAAAELSIGEATGPVQVGMGYAVLQLDGRSRLEGKAYADVRDEIQRQLALEQAKSLQDLQQSLLVKYGAKVLEPDLIMPDGQY